MINVDRCVDAQLFFLDDVYRDVGMKWCALLLPEINSVTKLIPCIQLFPHWNHILLLHNHKDNAGDRRVAKVNHSRERKYLVVDRSLETGAKNLSLHGAPDSVTG